MGTWWYGMLLKHLFIALLSHCIFINSPAPTVEKHPHTITELPPCLIVGTINSANIFCPTSRRTNVFRCDTNTSNLDSSKGHSNVLKCSIFVTCCPIQPHFATFLWKLVSMVSWQLCNRLNHQLLVFSLWSEILWLISARICKAVSRLLSLHIICILISSVILGLPDCSLSFKQPVLSKRFTVRWTPLYHIFRKE